MSVIPQTPRASLPWVPYQGSALDYSPTHAPPPNQNPGYAPDVYFSLAVDREFETQLFKPKRIKFVFAASKLSTHR